MKQTWAELLILCFLNNNEAHGQELPKEGLFSWVLLISFAVFELVLGLPLIHFHTYICLCPFMPEQLLSCDS